MHLWDKKDPLDPQKMKTPEQISSDRAKILPEVGMTAIEAGLSVVAGPMTGEITRMAQGIEAVSGDKPAGQSTSTPVIKYK